MDVRWLALIALSVLSGVACAAALDYGKRVGLIDQPGARRSHRVPTVRGGGLGALLIWVGGVLWGAHFPSALTVAVITAVLTVSAIGWWDDHRPLPIAPRLLVQLMAIGALIGLSPQPEAPAMLVGAFCLLWFINLFNFMDGIDALAAQQLIVCGIALALLNQMEGRSDLAWMAACLAASVAGFIPWNLPAARLFLGDVGSGFGGAALAGLGWWSWLEGTASAFTLLVLGGTFIVDATATLAARVLSGGRWYAPHREHAYQRLAMRWGHLRVVVAYAAVNVIYLWPLALACQRFSDDQALIALAALIPLFVGWMAARRLPSSARA